MMSPKEQTHDNSQESSKQGGLKSVPGNPGIVRQSYITTLIQGGKLDLRSLTPRDVLQLQRLTGNQAVGQLMMRIAQRQVSKGPMADSLIQRNGYPHPLKADDAENRIGVLNLLRASREDATLRQLLLEQLPEAHQIMKTYEEERSTGRADIILLRSILATLELHRSGVWYQAVIEGQGSVLGEDEKKLIAMMQDAYDRKAEIAKVYNLSSVELHAIECYTQPGKNNSKGPWFMGPHEKWKKGGYLTGWDALNSAMEKLPSLHELGLELTTYRAVRSDDKTRQKQTGSGQDPTPEKLSKLSPETNIRHGQEEIPPYRQKHYMSTGITYTSSHMTEDRLRPGLVAMTGSSGRYIGPLGVAHWSHDAGEILYPPEVVTKYEGVAPRGWSYKNLSAPIYHLREVARPERGQEVVEDKEYKVVQQRDPQLERKKTQMIMAIDKMAASPEGREKVASAREATGIDGPIMYLDYGGLSALYFALFPEQDLLLERKMQMIMAIDKMATSPKGRERVASAREATSVDGPIMYLDYDSLMVLYNALFPND